MNKNKINKSHASQKSVISVWDKYSSQKEVINALNSITQSTYLKSKVFKEAQMEQQLFMSSEMNKLLKDYLNNRDTKTPHFYSILSARFAKSKLFKCFSSDQKLQFMLNYLQNIIISFDSEVSETIKLYLNDMECNQQEIRLIVEYILQASSQYKVSKVSIKQKGDMIEIRSYLVLVVFESVLVIYRKERDWNQQSKIIELKQIISTLLDQLVDSQKKQHKQFLSHLIHGTFVLLKNNHPISIVMINNLSYSLQNQYKNLPQCQQKMFCLQKMCEMGQLIIHQISSLPQIEIESINKSNVLCNFCKIEKKNIQRLLLLDEHQEHQLIICENCRLSNNKLFKRNDQNYLVDLLLLMFCRAEGDYGDQDQMKLNQVFILELLSPLGVKTKQEKSQISNIIQIVHNIKIQKRIKVLSKLASSGLVFFHQNISLKNHLSAILQSWIEQTSNPQHSKRTKGLKLFRYFTQILKYKNPPQFVSEYVNHINTILKYRSDDIKQSVRQQSLKQILKAYNVRWKWQYLSIFVEKMNDTDLQIRQYVISNLIEIEDDIVQIQDKDKIIFIIEKLMQRTSDQYETIRQAALTCLKRILVNKKTLKIIEQLIFQIMNPKEHECYPETIKGLVEISINEERIQDKFQIIAKSIVKQSQISKNQAYFLYMLALHNPNVLKSSPTQLLLKLKDILKNTEDYNFQIIQYVVRAASTLFQDNKMICKVSTQLANSIVDCLQDGIYNIVSSIVKYFIPLYTKLSIYGFSSYKGQKLYLSCYKLMKSIKSKDNVQTSEYNNLERSLIILTLLGINLIKHSQVITVDQIIDLYNNIIFFAGSRVKSVRYTSIWCICQFWSYNQEFLALTFDLLKQVTTQINDDKIILTIYNHFYRALISAINNKNTQNLEIMKSIFIGSYLKFFQSNNTQLRLIIIKILERLFKMGLVPMHLHNKCIYCYLCDSNDEIRQHAVKIVEQASQKTIFLNFTQVFNTTTKYIFEKYGKIVVKKDDLFFSSLIKKTEDMKLKKKQRLTFLTFTKKLSQFLKDSTKNVLGNNATNNREIELICKILVEIKVYQINDYQYTLKALQHFFAVNSYKVETSLKKYLKKQNKQFDIDDDKSSQIQELTSQASNQTQSISQNQTSNKQKIQNKVNPVKAAQLLYFVKQTIKVLTGGESVDDKIKSSNLKQIKYITVKTSELHLPDDIKTIYYIDFDESFKQIRQKTPTRKSALKLKSRSQNKGRNKFKNEQKRQVGTKNKSLDTPKFKSVQTSPKERQKSTHQYNLRSKRMNFKN